MCSLSQRRIWLGWYSPANFFFWQLHGLTLSPSTPCGICAAPAIYCAMSTAQCLLRYRCPLTSSSDTINCAPVLQPGYFCKLLHLPFLHMTLINQVICISPSTFTISVEPIWHFNLEQDPNPTHFAHAVESFSTWNHLFLKMRHFSSLVSSLFLNLFRRRGKSAVSLKQGSSINGLITYFDLLNLLPQLGCLWRIHLARIIGVSPHSHHTLLMYQKQLRVLWPVSGAIHHQVLWLLTCSSVMTSTIPRN